MARHPIGPTLDQLKAHAEERVDAHFRPIRERQGLYLGKTAEARKILAGERSTMIEGEANFRKLPVKELAEAIVRLADEDAQAEVERVKLKDKIRKAHGLTRLRSILKPLQIDL